MTIPVGLVFDKVRCIYTTWNRETGPLLLYNGNTKVHFLNSWDVLPGKGAMNQLKSLYISGSIHFDYYFSDEEDGLGPYHEDYLPPTLQWGEDQNVVIQQIRHENRLAATSVNPNTVVVWTRAASGTTPTTPSREFAGNTVALFDGLETDGWTIPQPTGTNPLWSVRVTYSYDHISDTYETHYSAPSTEAMLYSTDGGLNYSSTRPTNTDDIDFIGYHTDSGWHYIPYVGSVPEAEDPEIVSPYRSFSNDFWQNNSSFPYQLDISSIQWDDIYVFGFDARERNGWSDLNTDRWRSDPHLFVSQINWSYEGEREHEGPFIAGKTYLLLIDRTTGRPSFALANNPNLSDYSGQGGWLIAFERYPKTFFTHNITDSATSVEINSNRGLEVGDTIFANDEQMTIVSIENIVRITGGVHYHQIGVTRGVNGTTAQAHSMNDTVRAIYNYDFPRYVTVLSRSNVASYTSMRPFYLTKRGVE